MHRGDTFTFTTLDTHLWVIVSCPTLNPTRVVSFNVSTYESYKESACILDVGDHPWVKHESCIMYDRAEIRAHIVLEWMLANSTIEQRESMGESVLDRIYAGAEASVQLDNDHADILVEQGFILASPI